MLEHLAKKQNFTLHLYPAYWCISLPFFRTITTQNYLLLLFVVKFTTPRKIFSLYFLLITLGAFWRIKLQKIHLQLTNWVSITNSLNRTYYVHIKKYQWFLASRKMVIVWKKSMLSHHLTFFLKNASADNFKRLKHSALLKNGMRIRRHRTWKKMLRHKMNIISFPFFNLFL